MASLSANVGQPGRGLQEWPQVRGHLSLPGAGKALPPQSGSSWHSQTQEGSETLQGMRSLGARGRRWDPDPPGQKVLDLRDGVKLAPDGSPWEARTWLCALGSHDSSDRLPCDSASWLCALGSHDLSDRLPCDSASRAAEDGHTPSQHLHESPTFTEHLLWASRGRHGTFLAVRLSILYSLVCASQARATNTIRTRVRPAAPRDHHLPSTPSRQPGVTPGVSLPFPL